MAGTTTTLAVSIGRAETVINTAAALGYSVPFFATIDSETIELVAGTGGTACVIRRGANLTTPTGHNAGATITPVAITLS